MTDSVKKDTFATGAIYMLFSASALSVVGLLARFGGEIFSLSALIFWRFFAAFIFCVVLFGMMGKIKISMNFSDFKLHLLRAFFALSAQYCFFYYIQISTLLNATVLLNTGPLFIPLIEWAILRNRVGKSTWISCIVAFIGMILVLQPNRDILSLASLIGLLSGISQGASQVIFGINAQKEKAVPSVLYLLFFCSILSLLPYLIFSTTWAAGKEFSLWGAFLILSLGFLSTGNQLTRAVAYRHGTPSRLSVFLYFSVVIAGLFDWLIFHNIPNMLSIAGALLVVLGGALKVILRRRILG